MPPVPKTMTSRSSSNDSTALRIARPRFQQRLPGRRRILHDVDRERDHLARPRVRLAEHERQRHRQPVIDVHPVDDRHVELIEDRRLRDVPRELRMALHVGHRARSPAFVGGVEHVGAADGERRDHFERERRSVIVVDQHDDVRHVVGDPALAELVALEHRLPVRLRGLAEVDRGADGRDVRGCDACGDPVPSSLALVRCGAVAFAGRPPATIIALYSSSATPVIFDARFWNEKPSVAPIFARK